MLNERSELRLAGVHPDLARAVRAAAEIVPQLHEAAGFIVTEGRRTAERQLELVASGASRTMNSRHLTGHAVDLAATVSGEVRWELNLYYRLALAMRRAAVAEGVPINWGGCWETLNALRDTEEALSLAVARYSSRSRQAGRRPLIDGPHFELAAAIYP